MAQEEENREKARVLKNKVEVILTPQPPEVTKEQPPEGAQEQPTEGAQE
jgi:hypothetical protein